MRTALVQHLRRRVTVAATAVAGVVLLLTGTTTGLADSGPNENQVGDARVMWGTGHTYQSPATLNTDQLLYHGGPVERDPSVYLVYWGPKWTSGFSFAAKDATSTTVYTQDSVRNYIETFFREIGGSAWNGVQSQYCQGAAIGSVNCNAVSADGFIKNRPGVLKGIMVDPSPVPSPIVTTALAVNSVNDPIANEAVKAARWFGTYDPNATYFIMAEPGTVATAYGQVYCAYHSETSHTPSARGFYYAFMPYTPEQGAGCGNNYVNPTNDAFGHGYLDGYSIVAGHEYAEAVTDPGNFNSVQDGWNDPSTNENGDKCAWGHRSANITLKSTYFAVQPMWSNAANAGKGGCAFSL